MSDWQLSFDNIQKRYLCKTSKTEISQHITKHKQNKFVQANKNIPKTLKQRGFNGKIKYEEYEVEEDTERQIIVLFEYSFRRKKHR